MTQLERNEQIRKATHKNSTNSGMIVLCPSKSISTKISKMKKKIEESVKKKIFIKKKQLKNVVEAVRRQKRHKQLNGENTIQKNTLQTSRMIKGNVNEYLQDTL